LRFRHLGLTFRGVRMRNRWGCLLAVAAALAARPSPAQAPRPGLDFPEADLATVVIPAIAEYTGRTILVEEGIRRVVTLSVSGEVDPDEALELLRAALRVTGYALVPAPGGALKVMTLARAHPETPQRAPDSRPDSDAPIVTILRLHAADASRIAELLGPKEEGAGLMIAHPPTNSLIVATTEPQLTRLRTLVHALDHAETSQIRVVPLRFAAAMDVAEQIREAFPDDGDEGSYRLSADERTNSLVIAALPERLAEIASFVDLVDSNRRGDAAELRVVRVRYADAEALADRLREASGPGRPGTGGLAGQRGAAGRSGGAQGGAREPGVSVVADAATNSLLIRATRDEFAELSRLIEELDRMPTRAVVDIAVYEVETTRSLALGLDLLIPLTIPDEAGDPVSFATVGDVSPFFSPLGDPGRFTARLTGDPFVLPIVDADGNPVDLIVPEWGAQFTAAQGDASLRVLARPHLLVSTGEEHQLFAGDEVPVPVSAGTTPATGATADDGTTPVTTTSGFTSSKDIERQEVGVEIRVEPIGISPELIVLDLAVTVSSVASTVDATDQARAEELGPTINKVDLEATVRVPDGAIVLVGAAPQQIEIQADRATPFLSRIPILGWLFRTHAEAERTRRLVIAVQASAIDRPGEQLADSIQRRLAFQRAVEQRQTPAAIADAPYALLVATRATREAAESVVRDLSDVRRPATIVEWAHGGRILYDVYLTGFPEVAPLGTLGAHLRTRGYRPAVTIVR
jgi:general secretion pathway protein D